MPLFRPISLALVSMACLLPALAPAQGLGDAAKKEKQKRAAVPATPAKTYTESDLAERAVPAGETTSAPETAEPAQPGTPVPAAPQAASSDDAGDRRRAEEAAWRERVGLARERVDRARMKHEQLSKLTLVPGYEFVDAKGRTVYGSIEALQQATAEAKRELDDAQRALEDLLEQARRASVPPGWLR
jgi:hypothetical protein